MELKYFNYYYKIIERVQCFQQQIYSNCNKVCGNQSNIKTINQKNIGGSQMQQIQFIYRLCIFLQQSEDKVYQQMPPKWGTMVSVGARQKGDGSRIFEAAKNAVKIRFCTMSNSY